MIKVGIVGATGYTGQELVRLLLQHPECEIVTLTSRSYAGQDYSSIYRHFNEFIHIDCSDESLIALSEAVDVVFMALPHGIASNQVTEQVLGNAIVIDLGADYRLKDVDVYEEWYGVKHGSEGLLKDAVYGLCELYRDNIKGKRLIANPGCYTTCSILTLYPLIKEGIIDGDSIIIDAKSGVSGAGRSLNIGTHYTECNETIKAYKVASHRHTPEIEQALSEAANTNINIVFTPHLTPMNRGILVTAYGKLVGHYTDEEIRDIYKKYYEDEYFVRVLNEGEFPEPKYIKGSNFCDISFTIDKRTNKLIAVGTIDNLIKGAAGQAIQNMNIVFGLDENIGLQQVPIFPA